MRIGILVTSHKSYRAALLTILPQLEQFEDRLIVAGGYEARSVCRLRNTQIVQVDHDSYEYTGLIELMECGCEWSHVLCIQDTMELSPLTLDLARQADLECPATAANGWMCNLVLYRLDYLRSQSEFIFTQRNCTKRQAIEREGELWKRTDGRQQFPFQGLTILGTGFPYSENTERIKEYYPSLGIIKWKANNGHNMDSLVEQP